jgi:HPt (histidine-containing phosphotransfer) domain-containing protein
MNGADVILDDGVLEELAELGRELGEDVLGEVVNAFRKVAPGLLEEIAVGCQEGSLGRVSKAAHTLKGSSAQMGARRVAEVAREIEADARAERADRLVSLLARCRNELAQAESALTELLRAAP